MSTVSRDGLKIAPIERTGICEFCRRTFRPGELEWHAEEWTSVDRRIGHVTATLCRECAGLALGHCWHCGRLTGRADDLCQGCWEAGVA